MLQSAIQKHYGHGFAIRTWFCTVEYPGVGIALSMLERSQSSKETGLGYSPSEVKYICYTKVDNLNIIYNIFMYRHYSQHCRYWGGGVFVKVTSAPHLLCPIYRFCVRVLKIKTNLLHLVEGLKQATEEKMLMKQLRHVRQNM